MSEQEIEEVIGLFVNSAKVAEEAGFDGVELHSAHGCESRTAIVQFPLT